MTEISYKSNCFLKWWEHLLMIPDHHQLQALSGKTVACRLWWNGITFGIPIADHVEGKIVPLPLPVKEVVEMEVFPVVIHDGAEVIEHRKRVGETEAGKTEQIVCVDSFFAVRVEKLFESNSQSVSDAEGVIRADCEHLLIGECPYIPV